MGKSRKKTGGIVSFDIKVEGVTISELDRVVSIHIEKGVNKISSAKIIILDGEANSGTFAASSSDTFVPGKSVTIEAGYDNENKTIFRGMITGQSIQINQGIGSALIVECRDESIKMIVGRKSSTFYRKKDSEIISSIISKYSGISSDITATTTLWPEMVQCEATDWDFILSRAEVNGLIVTTLDNKVSVQKPNADNKPVLTILYGDNLLELNTDLNCINQIGTVEASVWDFKTQKVINGRANNTIAGPGNLSSKILSEVIGLSEFDLQTSAALSLPDLNTWSEAQIIKSEFSKILGEVKFQGSELVNPAKYLTLDGLGDRFNGDYFISKVVHEISEGNWITTAGLGFAMNWLTEVPDVMPPPAAGLLPGARGLMNGTVKKIDSDPDSEFRILVNIPLFDDKGEGIRARLSNFYSTNGAGAFFLPEVGDEVVLAFMNEDPRYPVILGSLYSSKNMPYKGMIPNERNTKKAIVSKSGINIEFDDENEVFTVTTPGKNTIILNDKDNNIIVKDENQNSIVMSSSGISIKSSKSINIEASQKLILEGEQGVMINSFSGDVEIKGMNIKENARLEYSAEGGATAQVRAGAELELKAAMININ